MEVLRHFVRYPGYLPPPTQLVCRAALLFREQNEALYVSNRRASVLRRVNRVDHFMYPVILTLTYSVHGPSEFISVLSPTSRVDQWSYLAWQRTE
jgi:hypothetical protein